MKRKGEITTGVVLMWFLGIIVALILYQWTFGFISTATDSVVGVNRTYTMPATGSTIDLYGQELIDTPVVYNRSNMTAGAIAPGNYTIAERVSTVDGLKRISIKANTATFAGQGTNISYTYGPEGYIDSSAARSVASLIAIFAALGIGIFVLVPVLREKFDL